MFSREVVDEVVDGESPNANVAVSAARGERLLRRIQSQAFDSRVVGLERVTQLILAKVKNANVSLLTT